MRILFLTQWFEPEPVFKGLAFAKELRDAGHEVDVITGVPNYPNGVVYPGYRVKWWHTTMIEGIRVTRVPLYPSHDSSAIARSLNYLSFGAASCLYGCLMPRKHDVMYVYHPPMSSGVAGAIIGMLRRVPFVIDVNDLWPESLTPAGMVRNRWVISLVGAVCSWVYRRAAKIVVVTPGMRDLLIERGVPADKLSVIYNWSDEQALQLPPADATAAVAVKLGMEGRFNVVFAGTMGKSQALGTAIRAAKRIEAIEPKVQMVFVGGGVEVDNLKQLALTLGTTNVRFVPRMPMNEVGSVLAAAQVLLVHLKDDPLFRITIPGKTQAYLGVGKPILIAVIGDAADLIRWSGGGRLALPEDEASLTATILEMARMPADELAAMGARGKDYYNEHLLLATGASKFLALLHSIARRSR